MQNILIFVFRSRKGNLLNGTLLDEMVNIVTFCDLGHGSNELDGCSESKSYQNGFLRPSTVIPDLIWTVQTVKYDSSKLNLALKQENRDNNVRSLPYTLA